MQRATPGILPTLPIIAVDRASATPRPGLVLGFGGTSLPDVEDGIHRLRALLG